MTFAALLLRGDPMNTMRTLATIAALVAGCGGEVVDGSEEDEASAAVRRCPPDTVCSSTSVPAGPNALNRCCDRAQVLADNICTNVSGTACGRVVCVVQPAQPSSGSFACNYTGYLFR